MSKWGIAAGLALTAVVVVLACVLLRPARPNERAENGQAAPAPANEAASESPETYDSYSDEFQRQVVDDHPNRIDVNGGDYFALEGMPGFPVDQKSVEAEEPEAKQNE